MFRSWSENWPAKVLLAVLMPLLLLAFADGLLRLFRYGVDPVWTVSDKQGDALVWRDNPDIGRLWFLPGQVRSPVPFRVKDSTNALRIVVLGESAAMGDPVPAFGLVPHLNVILALRYPEATIEVINAAMTAIDSSVIVTIARDIARLKPDVVVVYMGNNEVVGPFGPQPDHHFMPSLNARFARSVLWLRATRLGQFLRYSWFEATGASAPVWRGLVQFSDRVVPQDSPVLEAVHRRYAANLDAIVSAIRRSGADPVLATMASRPFWSPFAPADKPGAAKAIETHQKSLSLLATGDREGAITEWQKSRDLDPLRFRADGVMNRAVLAMQGRALVVDADAMLGRLPVEPSALFWDHVHLTPDGNYELAKIVAESMTGIMEAHGCRPPREMPARETVHDELVYTEWDDLNATALMHQRLLHAPFNSMVNFHQVAAGITARFRVLRNTIDLKKVVAARERLMAAVQMDPSNYFLAARLAQINEELEKWPDALGVAESLVRQWPHVRSNHHLYGRNLVRSGRVDEGLSHLEQGEVPGTSRPRNLARIEAASILSDLGRNAEALAMLDQVIRAEPSYAKAWYNRAVIYGRLGQLDEAARDFRQALVIEPDMAEAFNNLGVIALKLNRRDDAERHFRQAVEQHPMHASALRNLALVLTMKGDEAGVKQIASTLVLCDPDWNPKAKQKEIQQRSQP